MPYAKKNQTRAEYQRLQKKADVILSIARFIAMDQGKKSIILQIPHGVAHSLAREWAEVRSAAGIGGYPKFEEVVELLTEVMA